MDIGTAGLPLNDAGTGVYDRQTTGYWTLTALASLASFNYNIDLNYTGFTGVDTHSRIIERTNGGNLTLDGTHGTVTSPDITRTGLSGGISTTTTDFAIGKANAIITTQPFSYSGCNATFSVVVSGQPTITYQWQENRGSGFNNITNGGVYGGATSSSLTLTGATVSMNGYQYQCVITDGFGYVVTSNTATLTVSLPVVSFGYSYTSPITLNAASGTADLTDFPALISITDARLISTSNGGRVTNTNGYDIIFTDQSGNTLDNQIESYDPVAGQYIAWVRIPLLSHTATTTINMLYGNSAITTDPSVKTVWASNYKGVWHLNGTNYTDATPIGNNGTANATTSVAGKIAGGQSFNGSIFLYWCHY